AKVTTLISIKLVLSGHPGKTITSDAITNPITQANVPVRYFSKKNAIKRLIANIPNEKPIPVTIMISNYKLLMAFIIVSYAPITSMIMEPLILGNIIAALARTPEKNK